MHKFSTEDITYQLCKISYTGT